MNEPQFEAWERSVRARAASFPYPPTPDIAGMVRRRERSRRAGHLRLRLVGVATGVLLVALLLAEPQVRAGLLSLFQVGAIRIFVEPTAPPVVTSAPATPTPHIMFQRLAGETTLTEAVARADFPIRLPTHPGVGAPDRIFFQNLEGQAVILVWLDPAQPDHARLSLHQLSAAFWAEKYASEGSITETRVNGQHAVWLSGSHHLEVYDSAGRVEWAPRQLVDGNVLIWKEGGITYRLETILPLEEAIPLAESLR